MKQLEIVSYTAQQKKKKGDEDMLICVAEDSVSLLELGLSSAMETTDQLFACALCLRTNSLWEPSDGFSS